MKKRYLKSSCLFVLVLMILAVIFPAGAFAQSEVKSTAATGDDAVIGVAYRGHVQNLGNMPTPEGTMIAGPEALGTTGKGLRLEGFWIDLTGDVPANAGISYQVHVQNVGWQDAVNSGDFSGTKGRGLRIEAIKITLENLPDYDVYYRGHVQNVGNIPQIDGDWGWVKNGEELGTTGKGLRLEELQIKIVRKGVDLTAYNTLLNTIEKLDAANYSPESWATLQTALTQNQITEANSQTRIDGATQAIQAAYDALSLKVLAVYDKPGIYGPETGTQTIEGSVVIAVSGVTLQNLVIKGDLTVSEAVGDGNATLNNLTVEGNTILSGGGTGGATLAGQSTSGEMTLAENSGGITIDGGFLNKVMIAKNDHGGIRITVINSSFDEFEVIDIPEGQPIILDGWFKSVMIQVPDLKLEIKQGTMVERLIAGTGDPKESASGLVVSGKGEISNFEVGKASDNVSVGAGVSINHADIRGDNAQFNGNVIRADITGENAGFRNPPLDYTGNPPVIIAPPAPPTGGGGGGGSSPVAVSSITVTGTGNATTVLNGSTLQMLADVLPANATNKVVTWSVTNGTGTATISETTGLLTATGAGTVTVKAVAKDGSLKEGTTIITITAPVIGTVTPTVTTGDGKVVLAAMNHEAGYTFYYKNTNATEAANKPALDATDLTGWTAFSENKDITGDNGTEIFVQVVKVDTNGNKIKAWGEASATPVAAPALGAVTPTVTAGDGKVVLTAMSHEAGYTYYYKNTNATEAANKPALDATDLTGWTAFSENKDITGDNGTEIFVQVVKVDTNGNKIKAWGEASATPVAASALGAVTPTVTAGDGKVVLTAMSHEEGYAFYYKKKLETDAANKPALDATDLTGWTAFSENKDITGGNGTEIFVQVVKVDTNGNKIKAWGEASATPKSASAELIISGSPRTRIGNGEVVAGSGSGTGSNITEPVPLTVPLNGSELNNLVFDPSVIRATVSVCLNDGTQISDQVFSPFISESFHSSDVFTFIGDIDTLWVRVESEDGKTTKYYKISVTW